MGSKMIAVAGKGGTGKTTFTALVLRELVNMKKAAILAVDADPNANLNEALGLDVDTTIAEAVDSVKAGEVPTGMTKEAFIEWKLSQSMIETKYVDLLVLGVPTGQGCYCYPNDLLRRHLDNLRGNYDYVVTDNEAGLEHLSRQTVQDIDYFFIISDASARSIRSAGRVKQIVDTLHTKVHNIYLVVTKVMETGIDELMGEIEATGLQLVGTIPYDPEVAEYDLKSKALYELPENSKAVVAVKEIIAKTGL
ncbi:AAA family ATPase [Phosphitispora fastidiosa]|uniref:ATP-binding protein n=1 Tax=Phosphitispora fastidiosa TaxID=2837202 RepID=UPI001E552E17|nr:AAA family ATPase [Phosphitispora fastidiosa]MBU7005701.1 CO dehydrogenase maturation factor [Phosphitispora fastidiosa]